MSVVANRRSVMSCFSSPTDPECHRARIVLAEKDITVEIHDVDTNNLPEDLLDLNPYSPILISKNKRLPGFLCIPR